ncbi:MAG: MFS transporter [Novosphingobium sp.]
MKQASEFRRNWRVLAGALLGIGSSLSLNSYILSTFQPYFLQTFGWTKPQWAALGAVQLLVVIALPVVGRMADIMGVWRTAAIGAVSFPLFLLAIALMDGNITHYLMIYIAQTVLGATATSTVYARVVAERFNRNRGLALGLCSAGSPLVAAVGSPLVSAFVRDHGFRAGYLAVALFCAVGSVLTLWLLWGVEGRRKARTPEQRGWGDYRTIFAMPVFWFMILALFLVNLPFSLATAQIKLAVSEQGLPDASAALIVSAFAIASVAGRFVFGFAIDRLPSHRVAAVGFGLPMIGLLLLLSPLDSLLWVMFAMVLIGAAFGSEADVIPFLVSKRFGIERFGTVLGLMMAATGGALGMGNVLLAVVLKLTGSFDAYLLICAGAALVGSLMFLSLGARRFATDV